MTKKQPYGYRIKVAREMKGLSLQQLADRSSIANSYLWNLEYSRPNPSLHVIEKLATALDVHPAWIAWGKNI